MKHNVSISTLLVVRTAEDEDRIAEQFCGTSRLAEDVLTLCYDEPDNEGGTTLTADGECATVVRSGIYRSHMSLMPGKRTQHLYETPQGALPMSLSTTRVSRTLTPDGGIVEAEYAVSINGIPVSENALRIEWKNI